MGLSAAAAAASAPRHSSVCSAAYGRQSSPQQQHPPEARCRRGRQKPENTFVLVQEGTLCLAVVPVSEGQPVSILGNVAQQDFHVGFDLDARTVTFANANCASSSSA